MPPYAPATGAIGGLCARLYPKASPAVEVVPSYLSIRPEHNVGKLGPLRMVEYIIVEALCSTIPHLDAFVPADDPHGFFFDWQNRTLLRALANKTGVFPMPSVSHKEGCRHQGVGELFVHQ